MLQKKSFSLVEHKMQKTVLVTGASRGIGREITLQLLQAGYKVIGLARTFQEKLENFTPIEIDLSDLSSLPTHLKQITKDYPDIQAIVCNAGRGEFGNLEEFSYEKIKSLIDLNFLSQVYLIKAFLPLFKKRQSGDLIFIGSEAALSGKRGGSIYCASKFALRGFVQALREECSISHVRVSLINPGMVRTDFFQDLFIKPGEHPSEHIVPEDIAKAVLFILSSRNGTVFDEINLSPQKKKVVFERPISE